MGFSKNNTYKEKIVEKFQQASAGGAWLHRGMVFGWQKKKNDKANWCFFGENPGKHCIKKLGSNLIFFFKLDDFFFMKLSFSAHRQPRDFSSSVRSAPAHSTVSLALQPWKNGNKYTMRTAREQLQAK